MPRPKLPEGERRDVPIYSLLRRREAEQLDGDRGIYSRGAYLRKLFLESRLPRRTKRVRK